ncbi:hypothetical protein P9597_11125 [Aneurinibacillus migulanus]|uniref:hypothetical protein n=1 Tax=Aneurinibacillus migulanus TaxID=47500 RepID=UPI002E2257C0|nr:hypothetical protein [Aneurinibacillus migulanus]
MKKLIVLHSKLYADQRGEAGGPKKQKNKKKQYIIMAAAVVLIIIGLVRKI